MHPIHARHLPSSLGRDLISDADRTDLSALAHLVGAHWQLSVRSCLDQITVPATLINGRFERRFQPSANLIRDTCPQIAVIDTDAGHSPNVEAADVFNSLTIQSLTGDD